MAFPGNYPEPPQPLPDVLISMAASCHHPITTISLNTSLCFYFFYFYINLPTYSFVFVVVKAAVMCENKPPLPPAFNQTRLGTLVKVTTTWGSWCVRTSSNIWSNGQHENIRTYNINIPINSFVKLWLNVLSVAQVSTHPSSVFFYFIALHCKKKWCMFIYSCTLSQCRTLKATFCSSNKTLSSVSVSLVHLDIHEQTVLVPSN